MQNLIASKFPQHCTRLSSKSSPKTTASYSFTLVAICPMETSSASNSLALSRRAFVRSTSVAATMVAYGFGLTKANGQSSATETPPGLEGTPADQTMKMRSGPNLIPSAAPLQAIDAHVCGLHFYSGNLGRQVIAHHYCSHCGNGMHQCVIYDSDQTNARLVGIEYIISAELFGGLPAEEKQLWHSHAYEVKSGQLTAPGISAANENDLMIELAGTYGKTWYTWQVDRGDKLPLGIPQLMMAFVADGQANPELLAARDKAQGISTAEKRISRADIVAPVILPGADAWQKAGAIQLQLKSL